MARTQSADYDRRKQAIVETAASLFAKRGFLGTSVADIAQACRTSKALVYHYFSSKEDVLYAAMSAHLGRLAGGCRSRKRDDRQRGGNTIAEPDPRVPARLCGSG